MKRVPRAEVRGKPRDGEPPAAEIVTIGREFLRGRTWDTNARELAAFLSQRGVAVRRITTVDDDEAAITAAVAGALEGGARLVVTTGGLGPMADDRTLGAVADALRVPLAIHTHAKEMVEAAYKTLHQRRLVLTGGLTAAREKMCSIPIGAEPIPNAAGIAPGIVMRIPGGGTVLCLPGIPAEMRSVLLAAADSLKDVVPTLSLARREVETPTADESSLRALLDRLSDEFPFVWIKTEPPGFDVADARVRLVFEASAPDRSQAESIVEDALRRLLALATSG